MSSINDPQEQDASPGEGDTVGKGVFSNIITETPSSPQNEEDEQDLASQTAKLALNEHTNDSVLPPKPSTTTSLAGEFASATMDENTNPKLAHATTAPQPESEPTDMNQVDEATILANLKEEEKNLISETSKGTLATNYEIDTPRFSTYLRLHNDVSINFGSPAFAVRRTSLTPESQMMVSKSTLTSDKTEQSRLQHHASHVARTLLTSHQRHDDLPVMMQVHACVVLGCSDENDCCERMQEALFLVKCALFDNTVNRMEGEETVEACERVLGIREQWGQVSAGIDDEGSDGSESENDDKDKDEVEDEGEGGDEGLERNDALP